MRFISLLILPDFNHFISLAFYHPSGKGYSQCLSMKCTHCDSTITKEGLAVMKFVRDMFKTGDESSDYLAYVSYLLEM